MYIFKHLALILIELYILSNETDACEPNLEPLSGRKKFEQCDCGMTTHYKPKRTVGAREVEYYHKYPWMVAIYIDGKQACGGTLIDTQYVLTAAHCLEKLKEYDTAGKHIKMYMTPVDISVMLSIHRTTDPRSVKVAISKYFIHPAYYSDHNRGRNDIAVIRLERSVVYTSRLRPICLSVHYEMASAGRNAKVIGWGRTSTGGTISPVLREVILPIRNFSNCDRTMGTKLLDNAICVGGEEGKDSCQGDSGGPLFYSDNNKRSHQIGIISWGVECGMKGIPAVYTNIMPFLKWIRSITDDSPSCEMMNPPLIKPNMEDCGLPQLKCTNNQTTCDSDEYLYSWMARIYHKNKLMGSAVLINRTHLITSTDVISPWSHSNYYKDLHVVLGMRRLDSDPNDINEVQNRIKVLYHVHTDKLPLMIIELYIMAAHQTILHRPICIIKRKEDIKIGGKVRLMFWEESDKRLEKAIVPNLFNVTENENFKEGEKKNGNKSNSRYNKTEGRKNIKDLGNHQVEKRQLVEATTRERKAAVQKVKMKELLRLKRDEWKTQAKVIIKIVKGKKMHYMNKQEITERPRANVQRMAVKMVNSKQCEAPKILDGKFLCGVVEGKKTSHEKGAVLMNYFDGRFYLLGIVTPDTEKYSRIKSFIDISGHLEWITHTVTQQSYMRK